MLPSAEACRDRLQNRSFSNVLDPIIIINTMLLFEGHSNPKVKTSTVGTVEVVISGGHPPIDYRVK